MADGHNDPAQDGWVSRVLGIDLGRMAAPDPVVATAAPAPSSANVRALWRDAKEETDAALEALASELRTYGDPDLERIADFGLFGIGKTENVSLNKALIEFSTAQATRRDAAARSLRAAVAAYRTLIDGDLVGDIDANPFGVRVAVRATLGRALEQIERAAA